MIYNYLNDTIKIRYAAIGASTVSAFNASNASSETLEAAGSTIIVFSVTSLTAFFSELALRSDFLDKLTNRHNTVVNAMWQPHNRYKMDEKDLAIKFCACVIGTAAGMLTHHKIENSRTIDRERNALHAPVTLENTAPDTDIDFIPAAS